MAQNQGNARNILVGASPLFVTNIGSTSANYVENKEPGAGTGAPNPAFVSGESYTKTLNDIDSGDLYYRNVGFTNNGLQITYNPTYDSVTVDQLLDTAKLFKSAMEVMIATEMSEGTLENVLVVFGQPNDGSSTIDEDNTWVKNSGTGLAQVDILGLQAGALGQAPIERQLIAVGQAPTSAEDGTAITRTERVYYARRVLSVQQSQFSLARTTPTTFPVTFRLLPDVNKPGEEYGKIIDRVLVA
jgi:hypothetical protein